MVKFSSLEVNGVELKHIADYMGIHINSKGSRIRLDSDKWDIEISEDTGNVHIYHKCGDK